MRRVTIRGTICWCISNTKGKLNGPSERSDIRPMTFGSLIRDRFRLVPLAEEGSNISASVTDVFPGNQWDPGSQEVFWGRRDDATPLTLGMPITAGVAHIHLKLPVKESGVHNEVQRTAIVMFGLVPKCRKGIMTKSMPWCYLIKNGGSPDLEQLFTSQVAADDGKPRTSLAVGSGFYAKRRYSENSNRFKDILPFEDLGRTAKRGNAVGRLDSIHGRDWRCLLNHFRLTR